MDERKPTGPIIIGGSDTLVEQITVGGKPVDVVPLATAARGREYVETAVRSLRGRGIRAWARPDEHPPAGGPDFDWWQLLVRPDDVRRARLALNDYVDRTVRNPKRKRSS